MKFLFFLFLVLCPSGVLAQSKRPLCAIGSQIVYAAPGLPPVAVTWSQRDGTDGHISTECTHWLPRNFRLNLALTGSFKDEASSSILLTRFGEISTLAGVRYWSIHDGRWQTLITKAVAVDGPISGPRQDFTLDELRSGRDLYYQQSDNRTSGQIVYRMQVELSSPKKLVIRIVNVSSIHLLMLSVFKPGDLESVYVIEQESHGTWNYLNLLGIDNNMSLIAASLESSSINRAVAMYRHFVGIPTDQNPPLLR